uniref:Uncharacterized protein n=1 Tax=Tanacetum cinerariifolium TaxID=118510 RepID=A0A699RS01_TANCI|nr:hypothetical protein [Tanacetum cinerariifolium]
MQMIGGSGGNQFRQYAGQNARNLNGYNVVQNVGNQVIQNVVQNPRVQNDGIQNQLGNGNLVVVRAEGNAAGHNGNQIRLFRMLFKIQEFRMMEFRISLGMVILW